MRILSSPIMRMWLLFVGLSLPALALGQTYSGPKCLGPFCLERSVPLDSFAQQLGGLSSAGGNSAYRTEDQRAFLVIAGLNELGYMSLRDFAKFGTWTKKDGKLTTQDIRNWKTSEGIGLGSSEEDVLKTYGKPSGTVNLIAQDTGLQMVQKKLIYKGRLNEIVSSAIFGIRSGKVSLIELESDAFPGPDCLGPYCYDHGLSLSSLYRLFHLSSRKMRPPSLMCIQSQDGQASMHLRTDVESLTESNIDDLLLSDFPNCLHMPKRITTNGLPAWKTPEGIGLGSSEEDVLKAYGKPSAEKKLDAQKPGLATKGLVAGYREGDKQSWAGIRIIIYGPRSGELQVTEFGMRDGRVSYI